MAIDISDLKRLQSGVPPLGEELLSGMTLAREVWLDRFKDHYLDKYIRTGGSKVKVLVGGEGTGKTHLLHCISLDARELGYETVYLSARDVEKKLHHFPSLYTAIVDQIDKEKLVRGLCCKVADILGYDKEKYDGSGALLPIMVEEEGLLKNNAARGIRKATGEAFKNVDFGTSFATFAYLVAHDRMVGENEEEIKLALKWLSGEKLERYEKQDTYLFERMQKTNARYWLNSLIRLLKLAGMTGLVVMIDNLEVMTERSPETNRFIYTPNAVKDTCELFRQIIDEVELLKHFLLVLAGRRVIIEDDRRGFPSYEALWMRLQTGLVPIDRFNPFSDIVDVDSHLAANEVGFPEEVVSKLNKILIEMGLERKYQELPDLSEHSDLRAKVMETALLYQRKGE